jgi:cytochrome c oxidase accessory protein FixG
MQNLKEPPVSAPNLPLSQFTNEEAFRDTIGTLDEHGKRRWIYPKSITGRYERLRTALAVALLAFLFAAPWVKIDGHPLLLFNVLERKFVLFAQPFWPQDFHLFVLGFLTTVLFIVLFTVAYGRIFCGWVCPQTIFMEHVFRRIEHWIEGNDIQQRKLDQAPWTTPKIARKTLKHVVFYGISFAIGNTFLMYLIGSDAWLRLVTEPPAQNLAGLSGMLAFSFAFYFVFSRFREQVCIIACPYGRLQGVLLDPQSIVVAYDYRRGEPRGKLSKQASSEPRGDCIDCKLCVAVCPTGIDIRNGTQLECINCTACIDACDSIMDRIGKPRGLVRYASDAQIRTGTPFRFTRRMWAYSIILAVLATTLVTLLVTRSEFELTVLRVPGTLYSKRADGAITNVYKYQLVNKTTRPYDLELRLRYPQASLAMLRADPVIHAGAESLAEGMFIVSIPPEHLKATKTKLEVEVVSGGKVIDRTATNFTGPFK